MKMGRVVLIGLILVLVSVCAFAQPPASRPVPPPPSTLGNLRVSLVEGDVQIKTVDTGEWAPTSINIPLKEGDELWVPEAGRMEIQIMPATFVRLDQISSLAVMTVNKGAEQLYLNQGRAYINFNPDRRGMIQVDTPVSSVQVYGRAVFKMDVTEQGYTDVSVLDGTVYVESKSGKTTVEAGSILSLREGTDADLAPLGPGDDWENWNIERDKRVFVSRETARYLPEELRGYAGDFESNGKWVYVKDYGQVWTPTVVVAAEWAPYRIGQWTWVGGDYVWVSYEPWGWAPYHYGRWAHVAAVGWFWVPPVARQVYWGPGYVGWVHTETHVAWVPLAPREVYYGYGHFGPHSVNLYQTNVSSVRITNVYRNVSIHNSVTIINNNTFTHGHRWGGRLPPDGPLRYTDAGFRGNPFRDHRIHVGRPLIKPDRSTMISIHRDISITRQPPPRIRDVNITRIRETRQIVRDHNVSAFTRGETARTLNVRTREGFDVRKGGETRRVVGPGGEIRHGGTGPGGYREGGKPGDRGPGDKGTGFKPGDRGPSDKGPGDRGTGIKPGDRGPGDKGTGFKPGDRGPSDKGPGDKGPGFKPGDKGPGDKGTGIKSGDRGPGDKGTGIKPGDKGAGSGGSREGVKAGGPGGAGPGGAGSKVGTDRGSAGAGPGSGKPAGAGAKTGADRGPGVGKPGSAGAKTPPAENPK